MLLETPYFSITINETTGFLTSFYIKNPGLETLYSSMVLVSSDLGNPTGVTYANNEFRFVFNSNPSSYCVVRYSVEDTWIAAEVIECANLKSLYFFSSRCTYDPDIYAIALLPFTLNTKIIRQTSGLNQSYGWALSGVANDCVPADISGFPIVPIAGAKSAIMAGTRAEVLNVMKSCALTQTEYPISLQGGAFADTELNRIPYLLAAATKRNLPSNPNYHYGTVEEWIEICNDLNFRQFVIEHGNAQYGTFIPDTETVPGGMSEVQYVVQKFKEAGITVGMHCLSYWLAGDLAYAPGTKTGNTGVRIPDTSTEEGLALLFTVADNLSNFFVEAGYDGLLYFDGIDTSIPDYYRTQFVNRVLNNIKDAGLPIPPIGDAIGGIRGRYAQAHFWEWDTPHPELPFIIYHTAVSNGPFQAGEIIRQSETQWGTFVSDAAIPNTNPQLYAMTAVIDPDSVQFEGGTITGENSGATAMSTGASTNGLSFKQFVDFHARMIAVSSLNIGALPTLGWVHLGSYYGSVPPIYTPTAADYEYLFNKCTELGGTYSLESTSYVNIWREPEYTEIRSIIRAFNAIPTNFSPCITEQVCRASCRLTEGNACAKFVMYNGAYIPALTVCNMIQQNRGLQGFNYTNFCK